MSLKVGITGGIGAGKSLVSEIFKIFGIPVYNSDMEAKRLMNENSGLQEAIRKMFGQESYIDGNLNRAYLAQIIFNNSHNLNKINELVHPVVINDYNIWLQKQALKPYTIKEAALLFESDSYKDLDKIVLVFAPKTIRINRILLRDAYRTKSEIESILENQMSENKKKKLSDYMVVNDGEEMVIPQILKIHESLMSEVR